MVNKIIEGVKEAGKILKDNFGEEFSIESKGDRNLVTDIDKKTQEVIVDTINRHYPDHGIFAEENYRKNLDSEYLWIIDPLDGTHNFIRNIDIFGVSVGLFHKEEFVLGVIYMPLSEELYVGEKGNGAYKNGKPIKVSSVSDLKMASISFDSSIRFSPQEMLGTLDILARNVFNIRMFGSSVRVLTYIAEGKLDFAIEFHDRPWDFAGGVCLIKEAGGVFKDLSGNKVTHRTIGYIASNKMIFEKVYSLLREHGFRR